MRILVFFDLPVETSQERAAYRSFRKFLIKSGFVMLQESVYSKIVLNNTVGEAIKENVRKHCAKNGLVQMLTVTERQFERMECVVGCVSGNVVDSDEKFVVL
ncbi:MAG TPA: CRISPR-associated endonuclease Cas2 [Firmicutes bacterium]|nr:CRISPR-associated endonuclease Cas2 [Bacillota bacterium]